MEKYLYCLLNCIGLERKFVYSSMKIKDLNKEIVIISRREYMKKLFQIRKKHIFVMFKVIKSIFIFNKELIFNSFVKEGQKNSESFMLKYINYYKNYEEFFYDGMILHQGITRINGQNKIMTIFVRSIEKVKNQSKENAGNIRI